ncbi:drug resistance transporter, EmrB/QacA subfamily [Geodermatophilus telluris]|uniref:Drug resistance transporter, EmrB/QacA subfamily n=1 Tax=Geodermatophilus telluris TaxID=1190417 RepID=A0A1G6QLB1_9ACTN|nr:MFS transporter [Geodermatophilus telluris]SDC92475.1 drug resistance transporter, EmrB/QacA subfamily [Geodermatophilus telluris]
MSASLSDQSQAAGNAPTARRLGLSLLVIATAQLMLVLDDGIANIALPSIQSDLDVSGANLPWVINAYVLVFGALLLFGGRVGDLFGRRRVLRIGLVVFIAASLLGGLAPNAGLLIGARALQGLGAALAAPNALALIATTFPQGKARNSAMAVYGAMSAVGIVVGVLLGGALTGLLDWRWVFFINAPIGLAVLAGTGVLAENSRGRERLDTAGAVTGTGAMVALVYGLTRAGEQGWTDALTLAASAAAAVLLAVFLVLQARTVQPLLPLSLFADRSRAGSYATVLFIGAGLMGSFYLLALFLQQVLRYGALEAGTASLPFAVGIILASGTSGKLVERLAPRILAAPGLLLAAAGMFGLSTLTVDSSYSVHVLPALFGTSFGLGLAFVPLTLTAVHRVADDRAGVASALVNSAQQIGAALGLAVLTTVSAVAADEQLPGAARVLQQGVADTDAAAVARASEALAEGYTAGFLTGSGLLLAAAVLVAATVTTRDVQRAPQAAPAR